MRVGKGPGIGKKKQFKKKKRGPGALATVDEEAPLDVGTVLSEEADLTAWGEVQLSHQPFYRRQLVTIKYAGNC